MKLNYSNCIKLSLISLIFVSCTLEPKFKRPKVAIKAKSLFVNQKSNSASANTSLRWWERLEDKKLNGYVKILLKNNLSLQEALQRVVQAKQQFKIDKGGIFPTISLGADASRNFSPTNSFAIPGAGGSSNSRFFTNSFGADISTSWELDLFGRIQSSMKASKANLVASEFDLFALEQSLIAQLVKLRISSLTSYQIYLTAKQKAQNQKKIYELTKSRYEFGAKAVKLADVNLAHKNFLFSEAEANVLNREFTQNLYAFDVLLGKTPGSTKIDDSDSLPNLPEAALTCLPISLLDRRPDLKSSEFRALAQNSNVGIALGDLYPSLSIGASIGYSSMKSSRFLTSDQLAGSLLSNITTKIFQGGALRANVKLQKSKAKEMALNYSNKVLEALREAESALQNDDGLEMELAQKRKSFDLLKASKKNAENRYNLGVGNLSELLQRKQEAYQSRQDWLRSFKARFDGRIDLYLALGGDWLGNSKAISNKCLLSDSQKSSKNEEKNG